MAACAFLLMTIGASSARAQELRQDARSLFTAGLEAAEDERWSEAADLFERAYGLSNEPIALYNLGYAYRSLGRFAEARAAFDTALASGRLTSERAERARTLVDELGGLVATVRFEGLPAGAEIRVDGRPVTLTGDSVRIDPGARRVEAAVGGETIAEWEGTIERGETRLVPNLVRASTNPTVVPALGAGTIASIASFSVAGAALVWAAVSSIAASVERSLQEDNCRDPDGCVSHDLDALRAWSLSADVSFGTSLAAAATGLVLLFVFDDSSEDRSSRHAPSF